MNYKIDVTAYETDIEFNSKDDEAMKKEKYAFIKQLEETIKTFSLYDEVWYGSLPKICYEITKEYKRDFIECLRINLSIRFDEFTQDIETDLKNTMKLLFKHTGQDIWFMANIITAERNEELSETNHISINTLKVLNTDLEDMKDFRKSLKIMKAEVK